MKKAIILRVTTAIMRHCDIKQRGEEWIYFTHTSIKAMEAVREGMQAGQKPGGRS